MPRFDDIRPYTDDEVPAVVARLVRDPELRRSVVAFLLPGAAKRWGWLLRPLAGLYLRLRFARVRTVRGFQGRLESVLRRLIDRTTDEFSVSGLDRLEPCRPYLFISNHRDIVMDPAFMNWALYQNGFDTVQIAIGDNLLTKPFVADLMRLNKSFIVKRSVAGRREKLQAARDLSAYIYSALTDQRANIWIAQREGRAKDGIDRTNPAVVGMLTLGRDRDLPLAEHVRTMNVVPVAISYEYDPCDVMKARERYYQVERGGYQKARNEDVRSIALGMTGYKGRVHLAFGEPISGDFQNDTEVAVTIDRQVHKLYRLFATHEAADRWLRECPDEAAPDWVPKRLRERVAGYPVELRPYILAQYANAVASQRQADEETSVSLQSADWQSRNDR